MKVSKLEGTTHSESEAGRELVYVDEFKQLINDNPGVISSFLKFDDIVKEKNKNHNLKNGEIFEEGNLRLTTVDRSKEVEVGRPAFYYKAEIGDESFFIKSIPGNYYKPDESMGAEEFQSIQKAKELLEGEEDVDVIDFQLGYEDKNGHTYFVSKWVEGVNINGYIEDQVKSNAERNRLVSKVLRILRLLDDSYYDVGRGNMMYDPVNKKIIVFDIFLTNKK